MIKLILGIIMVLAGVLGLLATLCGVGFMLFDGLEGAGMGLVLGVLPGALLLWIAHSLYQ